MSLRIITADARLKEARGKTTVALFGPTGVGKTFMLKSLPEQLTLCVDFEAGLKSVQDWNGDSLPVRNFTDALDLACLIGGINPAAGAGDHFNERHFSEVSAKYADLIPMLRQKNVIFVGVMTRRAGFLGIV
jgi:AAA domain-containing protein